MPEIFREQGFKAVIFPRDHMPPHVHVIKAGSEIRINLGDETIPPSVMSVKGNISDRDIVTGLRLVRKNLTLCLKKWREIHG